MSNNKTISTGSLICLSLTALCVSLPLNGLSPCLSLVASELGLSVRQRDLYLGGYVSLATMIGQLIGSCIAAVYTDTSNRRNILQICLIAACVAMSLFGATSDISLLLLLRVITGCCQGTVVPVIFSLIGDFCSPLNRASVSAVVSSCLGGGMMVGQLFVGYIIAFVGWRVPFFLMGVFTLFAYTAVTAVLKEPNRGGSEEGLADALSLGVKLPPLTLGRFYETMLVPTVAIMMLQTIPNTIPWGVLSAHLHDFLATDASLSLDTATSLIALFGGGAAVGGLFGGLLGAKVYAFNRKFLAVFMGVTMATSAVLLQQLLTVEFESGLNVQVVFPILVFSGALAAINGANIRVVVLNVSSPETRGAAIGALNFVNCLGRGVGPSLAQLYIQHFQVPRKTAIGMFLNLWFISSVIVSLAAFTQPRDEDRLKAELKKYSLMTAP